MATLAVIILNTIAHGLNDVTEINKNMCKRTRIILSSMGSIHLGNTEVGKTLPNNKVGEITIIIVHQNCKAIIALLN